MKKLKLFSLLMLLFVGVTSMWATDPEEIYKNEGAAGTVGGVTATGNINNTAANGNPAPAFGNTSASNKTFTFTGFSVSDYTNLELSIDAAFKNFPSTTNTWPYATVTFYKNEVVVKTDNTTIKWSSKVNTYSTYTIENIPDFDKIVIEGSPAVGKTGAGKDATNYGMYLDNIILTGENSATDPVVTFKQGDDVIDVLDLGNVGKNISKSATFSLSGSNLTAGKIELTAPAGFSVYPDEITLAVDGSLAAQTITVSKNTTTVDTYADEITIVGCGVDTSLIVGMDVKAPAFSITAGNLAFGTVLQYADHPTKIVTLKGQYVKDQVAVGTGSAIYGATPTRIDPDENGDFEQEVTVTAATEWSGAQNSYLTVSSTTSEFDELDEFAAITMSVTARYEITKVENGGGLVLSPDVTYAKVNDEITLTANTPDAAHEGNGTLKVVKTATPEDDVTATVLSGSTLTMPAYDITVSATYAEKTSPTVNASPASLDFGSPKKGESVAAKTFDLTGVALTAGTLTLSAPSGYTVSPTSINVAAAGTLSAQTITVTPNTGTAGTYNDNISIEGCGLASAATVPLTMTVQETYTVNWYVNNSIAHSQTDIAGADLTSIPTVAVLPEDCSEKVFLGWGTNNVAGQQDLVNIEGITMPVNGANYYAVFATQESEAMVTWTRVTAVSTITAGGTFILGYEGDYDNAKGTIVPLRNNDGTATTSANGIIYSGTTNGSSTNGTIDMGTLADNGTNYEVTIEAGTTSGTISIKLASGNYIGKPTSGNNVKLYSANTTTATDMTPTIGTKDIVTLSMGTDSALQFNNSTNQYRFTRYKKTQQNVVFYKKVLIAATYSDTLTICPHCNSVTLSAASVEHGSIALSKESAKTCEAAEVTVTPSPATGYELTNVALSGVAGATYSAGTISIPAGAEGTLTVTATFSAIDYEVALAQTGGASATLTGAQDDAHYGDEITVTASAVDGYFFMGWEATGVTLADSTTLSQTFDMPNNDVALTAKYTKILSVAEALALIPSVSDEVKNQVVEGYIASSPSLSSNSLTYDIKDVDENGFLTGNALNVYKGKGLNGADFSKASDLTIGDKVIIYGDLLYYTNYQGTTTKQEINSGNYLISRVASSYVGVEIYGEASKTEYEKGDAFEFTGLNAKDVWNTGYAEYIETPTWNASPATITANGKVSVTATYEEETSDPVVVAVTLLKHTITFNDPENGSLTVRVSGGNISSGAQAYKGETITIVAAPDEGYKIASVTANDEPLVGEDGNYSYNVGTEDVAIVATFSVATGFEDVETSVKAVKVLLDGQIFILRGDKTFNAQGQLVK